MTIGQWEPHDNPARLLTGFLSPVPMSRVAAPPALAGLEAICIGHETLLPGRTQQVGNATVYTNIDALNPPFARHLHADIYTDRLCSVSPVVLARLDSDAVLHGGGEYLVTSRGRLLREQFAPYLQDDPARVRGILSTWRPIFRIREECLLVARFGIYTWGHWLAEILPRLVLVEAKYPGRFRYVLPVHVWRDADPHSAWSHIRESLAAYGIGFGRQVLSLQETMDYQFDRLYAVSDIWSDHLMHPDAAAMMRSRLHVPIPTPTGAHASRIGLDRIGEGRTVANLAEIKPLLASKGFTFHAIGHMSFAEQVALFQSATVIFATLGSDLTGLLFAPEGVKVISVAPAIFGDRFFYALILDRHGLYADLRGPVTALHRVDGHRSMFEIDAAQIDAAMAALGEGDGSHA